MRASTTKRFVEENMMGPNALYLLEELCENLDLKPGMRVLDMGCGRGLTSIFLAKEYGVTVFANDLWVTATDNLRRFELMGVSDRVFPMHADARNLPYADGFFDAAVSVDSYHYYGTGEDFLPDVYAKLVKPGGRLGLAEPGLTREFENGVPQSLAPHWTPEMFCFHSRAWWQHHWEKTGLVRVDTAYNIPDAKEIWSQWGEIARPRYQFDDDVFIRADTEDYVTMFVLAATVL